jgi:hypothetical protein
MPSYDDFEANRIKHMEMIQTVVARLAGNSFLIKGWALTFTGLVLGFAVNKGDAGLAAVAFAPILIFWALDTYYLRAERLFRELFALVRKQGDVQPFDMAATHGVLFDAMPDEAKSWAKTAARGTVAWLYVLLLIATVLVIVVICTD